MIIYIDNDFKCHAEAAEGLRAFEVPVFDGKCIAFIEGYRFIPSGENWTRSDGTVFRGEMTAPWKDFVELDAAQREYERQLLAELQANSIPIADLEDAYTEGVNSAYD